MRFYANEKSRIASHRIIVLKKSFFLFSHHKEKFVPNPITGVRSNTMSANSFQEWLVRRNQLFRRSRTKSGSRVNSRGQTAVWPRMSAKTYFSRGATGAKVSFQLRIWVCLYSLSSSWGSDVRQTDLKSGSAGAVDGFREIFGFFDVLGIFFVWAKNRYCPILLAILAS